MSVGLSTLRHGRPTNSEQLINQADQAMYLAKADPGAQITLFPVPSRPTADSPQTEPPQSLAGNDQGS